MSIDFSNIKSVMGGINKILKLDSVSKTPTVPPPLILAGSENRSGLSPTKIASRIISRKGEAGLSPGTLPSGSENPDDIMIRIMVEEIINALITDSKITIAVSPGIAITAAGSSTSGPVTVYGSTITIANGYGVIQ